MAKRRSYRWKETVGEATSYGKDGDKEGCAIEEG